MLYPPDYRQGLLNFLDFIRIKLLGEKERILFYDASKQRLTHTNQVLSKYQLNITNVC
jgi:hypothetical protein